MTLICYRDGTMAADTAVWSGDVAQLHSKKVFKSEKGALLGLAGNFCTHRRFLEWFRRFEASTTDLVQFCIDEPFETKGGDRGFSALIVISRAEIWFMDDTGQVSPEEIDEFCAIGYETAIALSIGAMEAGASAAEAVAIALRRCSHVAGSIDTLSLESLAETSDGAQAHQKAVREVELR